MSPKHRLHILILAFVAGFAGCAATPELEGPIPTDQPAVVLEAAALTDWSRLLAKDLRRGLRGLDVDLRLNDDGSVAVSLPVDRFFSRESAQLHPEAMLACSRISAALYRHGGGVTHVLASDNTDRDLEPASRLAARRADSVVAVLNISGVPATRLRGEGRQTDAKPQLRLLVRPVVRGAEASAWRPPGAGE